MTRRHRISLRIRHSVNIWGIPGIYILLAIALGLLMPRLDTRFMPEVSIFSRSSAVSLLSAIASGMLTFTGFVFSISFLMVQFGSNAYSPRLISYFLQDPVIRHSMGMFIATFIYALIALMVVDIGEEGTISDFTMLGALAGVLGSIIFFLAMVQHLTTLQVTNVLFSIGDTARKVLEQMYPDELDETAEPKSPLAGRELTSPTKPVSPEALPPVLQKLMYTGGPLAILEIDLERLGKLAAGAGALIKIHYAPGDYISNRTCLLEVRGGQKIPDRKLLDAISMGKLRTIDQDLKYAIRLMVDIAIRALSPAVNDPTTAVQALDQLDDLLGRISTRVLDVGYGYDQEGILRVIYPTPTWEDYIDLALHEIRYYGAQSLSVMRRLNALLKELYETAPESRKALVREHMDRETASIDRTFKDIYDRLDALQSDRQGIGLTREPEEEAED